MPVSQVADLLGDYRREHEQAGPVVAQRARPQRERASGSGKNANERKQVTLGVESVTLWEVATNLEAFAALPRQGKVFLLFSKI